MRASLRVMASPRTVPPTLRSRSVSLTDFLEQLRLLLSRHANDRINNGDLDPLSDSPRLQLTSTLFRELAGIAQ